MNSKQKPGTYGMIGVIAAFAALLSVLVGPSIQEAIFPKPPIEERIANAAVRIRDTVAARLKGDVTPAVSKSRRFDWYQLPYSVSLGFAGVGIIGGCIGYLRREDHRLAHVACGVASLTLAWHAVLLALGALILCVIIFSVLSAFGSG